MRPGEILGLQRGDLDFEEGVPLGSASRYTRRTSIRRKAIVRRGRSRCRKERSRLLKKWFNWMIRTDELAWVFSTENSKRPLTRDFIWTKRMLPYLKPIGLEWATFQVMRRTHASRSKEAGVDAHTRSAQMGNTVDVNENEYAVSDFKTRREAVRKLEAALTVKVKDNGESSK